MVLNQKLKASEKTLLVLYRQDNLDIEDLRSKVEYKNKSAFRKILESLQIQRYIAITSNSKCKISPLGIDFVEEKILNL